MPPSGQFYIRKTPAPCLTTAFVPRLISRGKNRGCQGKGLTLLHCFPPPQFPALQFQRQLHCGAACLVRVDNSRCLRNKLRHCKPNHRHAQTNTLEKQMHAAMHKTRTRNITMVTPVSKCMESHRSILGTHTHATHTHWHEE